MECFKEFKEAIAYLNKKENSLEKALILSRELIRNSATIISLLHNNKLNEAKKQAKLAKKTFNFLIKFEKDYKLIVDAAAQEYTEAVVLLAILENKELPLRKELNVSFEAYLLGLADLMGELRREVILNLQRNNYSNSNKIFQIMECLFNKLLVFRYSNSVLPNFKKKLDVARIQLEQARIELLAAKKVEK
jgi:translin